jgi:hypothetical protein
VGCSRTFFSGGSPSSGYSRNRPRGNRFSLFFLRISMPFSFLGAHGRNNSVSLPGGDGMGSTSGFDVGWSWGKPTRERRDEPQIRTSVPGTSTSVFRTRKAQLQRLARKGGQVLCATLRAPHPGKAVLIEAAVEVPPHLRVDETAPDPPYRRSKRSSHYPLTSSYSASKRRYRGVPRDFLARYKTPSSADRMTLRTFRSVGGRHKHYLILLEGQGCPPSVHARDVDRGRPASPGGCLHAASPSELRRHTSHHGGTTRAQP